MSPKTDQTLYQIRADYDAETITVYQAFSHSIADAALAAGTFTAPFSLHRMTWIKTSFLWLMERSNGATKSGQERILAVRLRRSGWDEALSLGVLTHPVLKIHGSPEQWNALFEAALVQVQWDPERNLRGVAQSHYAIQVGISRFLIDRYVHEWIVGITDQTPVARKLHTLLRDGKADRAKAFLPAERVYPVSADTRKRLGMASSGSGSSLSSRKRTEY